MRPSPTSLSRRVSSPQARAAVAVALVLVPALAAAQAAVFRTARGVEVATPAPQELDCAAMRRVLDAIDASGYRGTAPEPADSADAGLLDYENRLSRTFYQQCVHALAGANPLSSPFARGYDRDP